MSWPLRRKEALAQSEAAHYAVILTDLQMSYGSDLDLFERVRRFDGGVAVLVMSAHIDSATASVALEYDACAVLTKPFITKS